MSRRFVEGLAHRSVDAVRGVEKADRHNHSCFGAPLGRLEEWLGRRLEKPPARMDGLEGMEAYAARALDPHIYHREGFEFTARASVEEAVRDGVVLLEMSFDVRAARFFPRGAHGLGRFVAGLAERWRGRVELRPELGVARDCAGDAGVMGQAWEAVEGGAFAGIDLYSHQGACRPETVRALYERAGALGLKRKAHVGEFGGAEEVRRTVEVLGLDEVQHGVGAAESPAVMGWLADRGVRLNVCPSSNVALGAVVSLGAHPIRALYDHGVRVSVNTDDRMLFGKSVSQEFLALFAAGVFSAEELDGIRRSALAD